MAIARALVQGARLIAMDEPTTTLTEPEVKSLPDVVRRLKGDGVAVIFISHKLAEIFAVCERIVVLRNGVKVADGPASGFDMASLSQHMLGRQLEQHSSVRPRAPGAELLRLGGFGRDRQFRDVSFSLRAGEVLGVTGLLIGAVAELVDEIESGLRVEVEVEVGHELACLRHCNSALLIIRNDGRHQIFRQLPLDVMEPDAASVHVLLIDHRSVHGLDEFQLHIADMGGPDSELERVLDQLAADLEVLDGLSFQ